MWALSARKCAQPPHVTAPGKRSMGAPERTQDHVIWPRTGRDMAKTTFTLLAIVGLKGGLIKFECATRAELRVDKPPCRRGVYLNVAWS